MKKFLVLLLVMGAHAAAFAQDWLTLAETDAMRWDGRAGTVAFGKNRGGESIVYAEGRRFSKENNNIEFVKWYIKVSDCQRGYGKLVTTSMSGDFKWENDIVLQGGSVASSLADTLCLALKRQTDKGL